MSSPFLLRYWSGESLPHIVCWLKMGVPFQTYRWSDIILPRMACMFWTFRASKQIRRMGKMAIKRISGWKFGFGGIYTVSRSRSCKISTSRHIVGTFLGAISELILWQLKCSYSISLNLEFNFRRRQRCSDRILCWAAKLTRRSAGNDSICF